MICGCLDFRVLQTIAAAHEVIPEFGVGEWDLTIPLDTVKGIVGIAQ